MGQLVFQATLGGQVNLVGPNTASTYNINVPAVAGNMVTTGDTGTVTNTMLAGSIANAKLTNSSVTIGSTSISLGATSTTLAGLTSVAATTIGAASGSSLSIQSNGTTNATLDTSGNLGLGVVPSAWGGGYKAQQFGTTGSVRFASGNLAFGDNYYFNGSSNLYLTTAAASNYVQGSGAHTWYNAPSGTAGNAISFTQAMTLDASGNLVVGTTAVAAAEGYRFYKNYGRYDNGTFTGFIGGGTSLGSNAASDFVVRSENALSFGSGGVPDRVRIDSSGNLLVGTTTSPSGSGNIQAPSIYSNTTASVAYVAVSSAGLLQRGGVSALKYKQDIRDLESIDISKFRPVRYKSKCKGDDQTVDHLGFIADWELEAGNGDLITLGEDGSPEGFQYERMTAVLAKVAQQQQSIITTLTERITALEAK
jgi:hypothetical protein